MKEAKNLKEVNKAIKKELGDFVLCKGDGYFYVSSNNYKLQLKLASLYSTSIFVCYLKHQTIQQWVKDVKSIVEQLNK